MNTKREFSSIKKATFLLFSFILASSSGLAQDRKIQKAIDKAISFQNMTPVQAGETLHLCYRVTDCDFEYEKFNEFRINNSEYAFTDIKTENRYKYGYEYEYVVGFSFYINNYESNTLEYLVRFANNNPSLQMPSFLDLDESHQFYLKYVKPYPSIAEIGKLEFTKSIENAIKSNPSSLVKFLKGCPYQNTELLAATDCWGFLAPIRNNPSGIELFCENSPYNDQFLKDVDIFSFLESNRIDQAYVFYTSPNNGYIVNKSMSYRGGILNKQMHGKGKLELKVVEDGVFFYHRHAEEVYEGNFDHGYRNGNMTHSWNDDSSYRSILGVSYHGYNLQYEERGKCVNNKWVGNTELTVSLVLSGKLFHPDIYHSDVLDCTYNDGILVSKNWKRWELSAYLAVNNVNNDEHFLSFRVPRIADVRMSSNGRYSVYYKDGTTIYEAYWYENGEICCLYGDGLVHNADEAARYAYVKRRFDNAREYCKKFGIPSWAD